ncbi:FHA domain-containing protein [Calothrix sp. 336/3]|uniref:FHA domain-containing protein n=1 Tax=Calothrix sp. 336/3 TaxID=1337936 RepID=UPI0004E4263E|nr:FHA domain-containing protein [Calothrix sp. 336/3]AKG20289.1 hypothetical protein IJ00_02245 [Calothrix sp. 336/3]
MAEFTENDLERRLSLYQVFLKLYENHTHLLDEILQLEDVFQPSASGSVQKYVHGVIDGANIYIITNLGEGKTQVLSQPQGIWTIGRDRSNGIHLHDKYLSRRHGGIQYVEGKGFYLVDLSSTNGTFVNGEPIYQPRLLEDGDRIRLGSVTFSFFVNYATARVLPNIAMELLIQLVPKSEDSSEEIATYALMKNNYPPDKSGATFGAFYGSDRLQGEFTRKSIEIPQLNSEQQSAILEAFFRRQGRMGN